MTKDEAIKFWDNVFDGKLWAQDCFETWMYKKIIEIQKPLEDVQKETEKVINDYSAKRILV